LVQPKKKNQLNQTKPNLSQANKRGKGAALMFKVGSNQVIRGWDEAVRDMATGEKVF
jgi:FKBP-type peptidyl-prolyl cis-trans isomerase 2